jgi:hypothetical protein
MLGNQAILSQSVIQQRVNALILVPDGCKAIDTDGIFLNDKYDQRVARRAIFLPPTPTCVV